MNPVEKNRGGRPRLGKEAKRSPLSLRVTDDLRARVEEAAALVGRPMTQEIEDRLERSLRADQGAGGPAQALLFRLIVSVSEQVEKVDGQHWTRSATALFRFREAVSYLIVTLGSDVRLPEMQALMSNDDSERRVEFAKKLTTRQFELSDSGLAIANAALDEIAPHLSPASRR